MESENQSNPNVVKALGVSELEKWFQQVLGTISAQKDALLGTAKVLRGILKFLIEIEDGTEWGIFL